MSRIIKCGLIQAHNQAPADASIDEIKKANIDHQMKFVEEAGKQGVQILCFQEIFTTPYFCAEQQTRWYEAVEKIPDGPTVKLMQDVAKQHCMVIVVPIYEEEQTGIYYNSAAVIDADGKYLGKYRTTHILFPAGQPRLPVFRYRVCADRRLYLLRPPLSRRSPLPWFERSRDRIQSVCHGRRIERISLEARTARTCRR